MLTVSEPGRGSEALIETVVEEVGICEGDETGREEVSQVTVGGESFLGVDETISVDDVREAEVVVVVNAADVAMEEAIVEDMSEAVGETGEEGVEETGVV